ncbi:MAG: alpha/beta hydrolase [Methyloceanibacter sp.]|uniref:alpha/beta hydrolase n=1 Tax=Methyloceanibacter sp. TaxID=1965321 RepID=UPI003D9BA18A
MDASEPQFLEVGTGVKCRRIAYRFTDLSGAEPVLLWLPGFLADMAGTKAVALAGFARAQGLPMLRFDYSGHGLSPGNMLEASIGDWLEEAYAMLGLIGDRRTILIGSSMGGWIAVLLARQLQQAGEIERLAGLVLLAPAFDMTERLMWRKLSPKTKAIIETEGVFYAPSLYGDPYPLTKRLIEEGRNHLIGEGTGPIELDLPVRILQGMEDPDVPWGHALDLVDLLHRGDVELTLIKGGDHRLSRPQDLRHLELTVAALVEQVSLS